MSSAVFFSGESAFAETDGQPAFALSGDMGEVVSREAAKVRAEMEEQARSLFRRESLGWNLETVRHLYEAILSLPLELPSIGDWVVEESRVLGLVGSILVLLLLSVLLYSLLGRRRLLHRVETRVQNVAGHIPESYYPFFLSLLRVVTGALIPLVLVALFFTLNAMITFRPLWFNLTGRLLILWFVGALTLRLLKEILTRGLFEATAQHGKILYPYARLISLYILIGIAAVWIAEIFQIRTDVLSLLRFAISISIVTVLFFFFLKKKLFLSLFPNFPSRVYRWFLRSLNTYYYPLLMISLGSAFLWCFGYRSLGRMVLFKMWFSMGALLAITLAYYKFGDWLKRWAQRNDAQDETAQFLIRSAKALLLYATVLSAVIVVMNLLGLLKPLQRIMSFPMFELGDTRVTLWIIINAVLILLSFVFASRLLQAYLDYKVYPAIGVDPGLGYALNTFFKYLSFIVGFLISLKLVGLDLRFLLVFAGAAGIGIGLGLQNMAANIISGFSIIFGGKIRKGDWIEVGGTLGTVTDIYLRATKVRTRDNVEYLVPNSDLISNTIVNYSLSSPLTRMGLPVGVSYDANPREVERIMLEVAEQEPLVSKNKRPAVRFIEYGDNSINFELLFWIDVREVARRRVKSALYFTLFERFREFGIEIPFPQRDLHIRTNAA